MNTEQSNDKLELRWCSGVMLQFVHHSCNTDQSKKKNVEITQNRKHMLQFEGPTKGVKVTLFAVLEVEPYSFPWKLLSGALKPKKHCTLQTYANRARWKQEGTLLSYLHHQFSEGQNATAFQKTRQLFWNAVFKNVNVSFEMLLFWATVGTSPSAMWRNLKQNMIYNWEQ